MVSEAAAELVPSPKPIAGADGAPSRDASVAPEFSGAERAVVELSVPGEVTGAAPFTGVIVSSGGLVVAPAVRLRKRADSDESIDAAEIVASRQPGARCTAVVAVRGELALLRFTGLVDDAHRPVGAGAGAVLGELVAAITPGEVPPSFGFVTAELRHPGTVAPDGPRWGCGLVHMTFARAHPPVRVGTALASDVAWFGFGSLVVDRRGHPVALAVASRAPGLNFGVPWAEVLGRFRPWLTELG